MISKPTPSGALKLLLLWSAMTIFGIAEAAELCAGPQLNIKLRVSQNIRRIAKEKGYTEGLIFHHGSLYESLGLYGHSELRKIDPYTAIPTTLRRFDGHVFSEGLAAIGENLVQLTYKENVAFAYNKSGDLMRVIPHQGEGWGLTQLNGELIQSNGSAKLTFLDAATLEPKRTITVRDSERLYRNLNELEAARGVLLANVFGTDFVLMINPANGCVIGKIDLAELRTPSTRDSAEARCYGQSCVEGDFATNGIAYDDVKDELYFTGKNWPYIYVFKFPR